MNIFKRAEVIKILQSKVDSGEIKHFFLKEDYIRIQKSKRSGVTLKFSDFNPVNLLSLLKKKTPNPSIQNIEDFYNKEIKKLK